MNRTRCAWQRALDHLVLWLAYKEVKAITDFVIDDNDSSRPAIRKIPGP